MLKKVKGFASVNPFLYFCTVKLKINKHKVMENGILTREEITNGNSLIAKFDGYTQKPNNSDIWIDLEDGHSWRKTDEFSYDSAYGSLMSIVEKITKLKINGYTPFVNITNFGCSIEINNMGFRGVHGHNLITDIWVMVVNFLEWYELEYKN